MTNNTDTIQILHHKLDTIPSGWSSLPINEVFEFIGTSSFSRNDLNYEADEDSIYYIHYGDIHATYKNAVLDFDTETRIPVLNKDIKPSAHLLKEGDLLIADASEDYEGIGEALEVYNLGDKKALAGLHTFALRDNSNKTAHGYRAYIFKNHEVKNRLKTIATGSKVYGISKGNLTKFKITLPSYKEQQKIAQILATWDKAIVLQQQLIAQKQQNKKAIMKKLLTGEVRFKEFNDKWKDLELSEIGTIIRGASPRPKSDPLFYGGNVPRLMVEDVTRDGKYVTPKVDFLTDLGATKSRPCPTGTLTIVCSGEVGTPSFLAVDACIHDGFLAIINIDKSISKDFLYYQLLRLKARLERSATHGGVFTNLTTTILKNFVVKIPSYEEQSKIAHKLNQLYDEEIIINKQLVAMQEQKKGLMQQLLTGKLRVKI